MRGVGTRIAGRGAQTRCPCPSRFYERTGTSSGAKPKVGHLCTVRARKAAREADKMSVSLSQGESPSGPFGLGADQTKVAGVAVMVAVLGAIGIARKTRRRGSVDRLVKRGMLDEYREREDPYYQNMMKNINKVKVEPLSQAQIEEARKRRAGDLSARGKASSGKDKKDNLEDFSIPDNHPWAEKKGVSEDDEELIKARLAVKRGLPLETLNDE